MFFNFHWPNNFGSSAKNCQMLETETEPDLESKTLYAWRWSRSLKFEFQLHSPGFTNVGQKRKDFASNGCDSWIVSEQVFLKGLSRNTFVCLSINQYRYPISIAKKIKYLKFLVDQLIQSCNIYRSDVVDFKCHVLFYWKGTFPLNM